MLMRRGRSQVLLVDVQERLLATITGHAAMVEACALLLASARRLDVPITISEQYPKGLGPTVAPLRQAAGNAATTLPKVAFSCLADAGLARRLSLLQEAGRDQIVVAGIEAHVCVAQTALDLVGAGYHVYIAADAVGSRPPDGKPRALDRLARAGATIVDTEMAMFEWLERAGTPEFKELQGLIK